ncbi:hypothetical protein ACJX0J_001265 (mitochondrion) [Zea mays]
MNDLRTQTERYLLFSHLWLNWALDPFGPGERGLYNVRTHISGETAKKRLNIPVRRIIKKKKRISLGKHDELKLRKKSEASSEERQVHFIVFFSELKEEIT